MTQNVTQSKVSSKSEQSLLSQYQKLIKISQDLASTLELDALLNRIVHVAAELSNASEASILLYDDVKSELFFQAATNASVTRGLVVPVGGSIAGWIVTNQESIIIRDADKDDRYFRNIEETVNIPTRTLLGVPLITKDKVIGVLEAINKKDGNFTKEDQEILMTLGAQAAVAIENSRLFQQSDLIAEFVHEIRTPLSSITTATQLLQSPRLSPEKYEEMTNVIQAESKRLNQIATSFLDLAQLESGRYRFDFKEVNVPDLVKECVNLVEANAEQHELSIRKVVEPEIPQILADYEKLKQAILNLLSNAIKYNIPGGKILVHAFVNDDAVTIEVKDTGIGIPIEFQDDIFQKFYRVPGSKKISSGTGLGLSIVKKIIDGHKGRIAMRSEERKGTSFQISIPKIEST
jgi:signal transduction histidine kinase